MRNLLIMTMCLTFAVAVIAACSANATNTPVAVVPAPASEPAKPSAQPEDDAPRITLADAKAAFDKDEAVFVDTRSAEQYAAEHVKGAINIPFDAPESRYSEIPKGKKIIAYCS